MGPLNLISLLGIFVMIGLAWTVSSHRTKVNWRLVVVGVLLQAVLAAILFSVAGVVVFSVCQLILDKIPPFSIVKEIGEEQAIAVLPILREIRRKLV